ncbi:hypothetical protein MLD38_023292 [Melastoma candidum]|uniref:Uncharacterized protein n=1 Tax=Melastoma candidum TaxID=119954 RepID=A0ACB9QN88_9MYRT|nr:hypothetical protein MLD38_023292 [Melastoma candidum]
MGMLLSIVDGVRSVVSTLWYLQELRFALIFEDVSSLVISIMVEAVSCFVAKGRRILERRGKERREGEDGWECVGFGVGSEIWTDDIGGVVFDGGKLMVGLNSHPSWNIPLKNCVKLTVGRTKSKKLPPGQERLSVYSEILGRLGVNLEEYDADTFYWREQVQHYWELLGVTQTDIRNVMDMNAVFGGLAAALNAWPVWVMNVVPATLSDTLSAIYDRGLIGAYHDWCEPFSTYPRTYDLLHASYLFSHYGKGKEGCSLEDIILEMDRILRPEGFAIIRDQEPITRRIQDLTPKFLWDVKSRSLENKEKQLETVLICRKKFWAIA